MAAEHVQKDTNPSADTRQIAPTSTEPSPDTLEAGHGLAQYSCQKCAKRKVKCDKTKPICSSCVSRGLQCVYQAPPPRRRKRQLSGGDVYEKLAQYERILSEHGLLPQESQISPATGGSPRESVSLRFIEPHPETSKMGKVVVGHGKSRYVNSIIWRSLGDDEMQHALVGDDHDHEEPGTTAQSCTRGFLPDPLMGALMGYRENLLHCHPTQEEALILWNIHIESVEPICRVLHIPSSTKMAAEAAREPQTVSRADECVLFAVYHFASFSLTNDRCVQLFGQSRSTLMQRFHFATRQALVNASFLTTANTTVLQALILFLLACRHHYDPQAYWILTGVAVRIAQHMGLHRDGEALGLPPFEVQMRRRLFYQLIPLDGVASQLSGTGIAVAPESWDTQEPLNIDDDQIWPGMTTKPEEQQGATDMIFCLTRACVGKFFARSMRGTSKDRKVVETLIKEAESEVEERFIRYCDVVNPLHFLTVGMARSAIMAMRIRTSLPRVRDKTATDEDRKELFHLAHRIIDTDAAAYANTGLQRYYWHVRSFWAYGSWESLIYLLGSMQIPGLLSLDETDYTWNKVEQVYTNHGDLLISKQPLHAAFGALTLKVWDSNAPSRRAPEPEFIRTLRTRREGKPEITAETDGSEAIIPELGKDALSPIVSGTGLAGSSEFGGFSGGVGFEVVSDFSLDAEDWALWDRLIRDENARRRS